MGSDCVEFFKEKSVRLFGFEINPFEGIELSFAGGSSGGEESPNTSRDAISSKRLKVGKVSKKNFVCQLCLKAFGSSQALCGHQNAHKKQKMKSQKKLLAEIRATCQHGNGSTSSSWSFDQDHDGLLTWPIIESQLWRGLTETQQDSTSHMFTLTTSDNDHNLLGSNRSFN